MESSYTYYPPPKRLIENPTETYYNPFKEIKIFNKFNGTIYICRYISFVTYSFSDEGYISFYDSFGREISVKAYKEEKICDMFFKYLEKIEKNQIVCEDAWEEV